MSDTVYSVLVVAILAMVTLLLRVLPFLIFNGSRETPAFINYLGKVLPFAIMGMLAVYCLRSTGVTAYPWGIPELIATLTVIGLHLWKHNTLLSIAVGTACYMVLVQFIF